MSNTVIVIPSRLAATRLPNKPLILIRGEPMIVHVLRRGLEANIGPVVVACCGEEIANLVRAEGAQAVITDPDLPSGSDRVYAAMQTFDPEGKYENIINLQGDLPFISPESLQAVVKPFADPSVDIATLAAPLDVQEEIDSPHVVKIAMALSAEATCGRALYFSRSPVPHGGPYYHHIGVYGYRRAALERFVEASPKPLELLEKLEQLRALELGLRIDVQMVKEVPNSVDTSSDLEKF